MHHYKKIFLPLILFFSIFSYAQYEIKVNFESGLEFKSQSDLINKIYNSGSRNEIEKLIKEEDWIEEYTLIFRPFVPKAPNDWPADPNKLILIKLFIFLLILKFL